MSETNAEPAEDPRAGPRACVNGDRGAIRAQPVLFEPARVAAIAAATNAFRRSPRHAFAATGESPRVTSSGLRLRKKKRQSTGAVSCQKGQR